MDMDTLVAFAKRQEARFEKIDGGTLTPRERTYAQLAKLGEEYGELCEQVLAVGGHQRADKADKFGPEKLASEVADVIICASILSANLGIDLPAELEKKIRVIDERFKDVDDK